MALFGAAFGLGFVLGPAIAGILSKFSIHLPFYFAAGLSLTSAAAAYFLLPESLTASSKAAAGEGGRGLRRRSSIVSGKLVRFCQCYLFSARDVLHDHDVCICAVHQFSFRLQR